MLRPTDLGPPPRARVTAALAAVACCAGVALGAPVQDGFVVESWMRYVAIAAACFIAIIGTSILWNIRLRQLVKRRTEQLEAKNRALIAERAEHQRTHAEAGRLTSIFEATTDFVGTCDAKGGLQW